MLHALHFFLVNVNANDLIAGFGEARAGYEAYVTSANYCDIHVFKWFF
jgi:hypothetical protein